MTADLYRLDLLVDFGTTTTTILKSVLIIQMVYNLASTEEVYIRGQAATTTYDS